MKVKETYRNEANWMKTIEILRHKYSHHVQLQKLDGIIVGLQAEWSNINKSGWIEIELDDIRR